MIGAGKTDKPRDGGGDPNPLSKGFVKILTQEF
jgi:hypothetical protein